ncbi:MAG: ABC transporter permease, partial [Gammaproteobacteria bacterium]
MRQVVEITLMNLRSIPRRMGISFVICVGTASVVAVLVTVLSMATGLVDTLTSAAAPDRVVVMRKGALAESLSSLSREAVLAVETAPGIATRDGRAAVSPEVVLSVDLPRRDG